MTYHPEIHFDYLHHHGWKGVTLVDLDDIHNALREKVKDASGYYYDNSHFYIDDLCGHPALTVLFEPTCISFWNAKTGRCIGGILDTTDTSLKLIDDMIHNVSDGRDRCSECGVWQPSNEMKSFGYAGVVCKNCYNPKKHLQPDTRGD